MRINENFSDVLIDQALYGYKNGHSLLSTSLKVSSESQRTMLIMSDMSGPSMVEGFESYVTGYSLSDEGVYALSRTWHAPEMNRPGCVWTHTLLIKNSDLAKVKDLSVLMVLFVRPNMAQGLEAYQGKVKLEIPSQGQIYAYGPRNNLDYKDLYEMIYGERRPAYVFAPNSKKFEQVILDIWTQQWPRLRRSFSFCTGSISDRNSNNRTFDVQVIPEGKRREFSVKINKEQHRNCNFSSEVESLSIVFDDLIDLDDGSFRKFLWDNGADIEDGRAAFLPLAKIYYYLKSSSIGQLEVEEVVKILGENFRSKDDGSRLKSSTFNMLIDKISSVNERVSEILLESLSKTEFSESFDYDSLTLDKKLLELWDRDKERTVDFVGNLLTLDLNHHGQSLVKSFSSIVKVEDIAYIGQKHQNVLAVLARLNPALMANKEIWDSPPKGQLQWLSEAICEDKISHNLHYDICAAILNSKANIYGLDLFEVFGPPVVEYFFRWLNIQKKDISKITSSSWDQVVRGNFEVALKWINDATQVTDKTIAYFLSFISPMSKVIQEIDDQVLLDFSGRKFTSQSEKNICDIRVMFLYLGFKNIGPSPYVFLADSFQFVHDAAKDNRLNYSSWRPFEELLPELGFWRDWDKCERLRRGLAKAFNCHQWPVDYFLLAIQDKSTFSAVLSSLQKMSWGRKFLDNILNSNSLSSPKVESYKRDLILSNYRNSICGRNSEKYKGSNRKHR